MYVNSVNSVACSVFASLNTKHKGEGECVFCEPEHRLAVSALTRSAAAGTVPILTGGRTWSSVHDDLARKALRPASSRLCPSPSPPPSQRCGCKSPPAESYIALVILVSPSPHSRSCRPDISAPFAAPQHSDIIYLPDFLTSTYDHHVLIHCRILVPSLHAS